MTFIIQWKVTTNMTLKEWLESTGMTIMSLSKISGFSRATIRHIANGKPARYRTAKRLIRVTSRMKTPLTIQMFPNLIVRKKLLEK